MLILITGGSGSGKSEYAESVALSQNGKELIYIATMKPYGAEAEARIARHRAMRQGKGFKTIECYTTNESIAISNDTVVLLECMSNLVANEMFDRGNKSAVDDVLSFVDKINKKAKAMVVVTNDVFNDGINYDKDTVEYIRLLAEVNKAIAAKADSVTEVVVGIPITIKEGKKCL